jgi:TonB family protein
MRSKMLGLAIALTTFGLGVAATTAWIAYHAPEPRSLEPTYVKTLTDFGVFTKSEQSTPCPNKNVLKYPQRVINVGDLNDEATSKTAPVYPPLARSEQVSGMVVVQVVVDECGNVMSAKAVSGDPLLRQAAVDAATKWHFTPSRLNGDYYRIVGTITFNFLLQ